MRLEVSQRILYQPLQLARRRESSTLGDKAHLRGAVLHLDAAITRHDDPLSSMTAASAACSRSAGSATRAAPRPLARARSRQEPTVRKHCRSRRQQRSGNAGCPDYDCALSMSSRQARRFLASPAPAAGDSGPARGRCRRKLGKAPDGVLPQETY